jgi:hypothetical protein
MAGRDLLSSAERLHLSRQLVGILLDRHRCHNNTGRAISICDGQESCGWAVHRRNDSAPNRCRIRPGVRREPLASAARSNRGRNPALLAGRQTAKASALTTLSQDREVGAYRHRDLCDQEEKQLERRPRIEEEEERRRLQYRQTLPRRSYRHGWVSSS